MQMTRRSALKGLSAGFLAAAGSVSGIGAAFAAREKELNILCWEGYNSAQVLDPYRKAKSATVKAESLTNDPTMINRLRAGEVGVWDLINVNNPWARKIMFPEKLIRALPRDKFEPYFDKMLPMFKPPYKWAMSDDGKDLLGSCQRFGPYCFVVNTKKISRQAAETTGWDLFNDPALAGKYGILESDDWNVFGIFVVAGIDPFKVHTEEEIAKFEETAKRIFKGAKLIGDIAAMNQALVSGEIDLHFTGGTYSVSPARADGNPHLRGITPKTGPMAGGKGGIAWIEVTSTVNNPEPLAARHRLFGIRAEAGGGAQGRLRRGHVQSGGADGQSQVLRAVQEGGARRHPVGQPGGGDGGLGRVRHRAGL